MIKPIDISPINTATHACFHCINCGAKEKITISMINTDNEHEIVSLREVECPYCGMKLGMPGLPKFSTKEITHISNLLFKNTKGNYPTHFYLDLLFNERSPYAQSKEFQERFHSLLMFLTNKRDLTNDGGILGEIFSKILKYFLEEGYFDQEEYQREYTSCMQIWNKYFSKGDE